VIVRVISVPRTKKRQQSDFEKLVSNIVAATNWQNAILASDLRANDARQVFLQREFAKLKYHYMRKRQTKREAKRILGAHYGYWIKMDELAQLVAACEFDPEVVRSGKQGLFQSDYYDSIFDGRSVQHYLSIYWLGRIIKSAGSGYPDRAYAKWHALHFLWKQVGAILKNRTAANEFRRLCEAKRAPISISGAANEIFKALEEFYRIGRGKGPKAVDVSNFFYRARQHKAFEAYWTSRKNHRRARLSKNIEVFAATLRPE
jgi:hypothetical protein